MKRYRGRFNVVGARRRVSGTVKVASSTRRVTLDVDDHFDTGSPFDFHTYPAIHGELVDGTSATLLDCAQVRAGSAADSADPSAAAFRCRFWLQGGHLEEATTYSRLRLSLTDLLGWIGQPGFSMHTDVSGPEPIFSATTRPSFSAAATTTRGSIRFRAAPTTEGGHREARFSTRAWVEVIPEQAITLDEAFSLYIRPLQDLLTLATGRSQEVKEVSLTPSRAVPVGQAPRDEYDWIEARFERWANSRTRGDAPFKDQMLFSLSDLDGTLASSLNAWFRFDQEIREVRSLATASVYRDGMFADQKFLYAAQALETYHRRRMGGRERTKKAHKALVEAVIDAAPAESRSWVREKLAWSNELSLLHRLQELRARVCQRVEAALANADKWGQWARDTRNYHTHYTRKARARIAGGKQLIALTESLLLVLDDLILEDLGLSAFARNDLIARTKRYRLVSTWFDDCDWSSR